MNKNAPGLGVLTLLASAALAQTGIVKYHEGLDRIA